MPLDANLKPPPRRTVRRLLLLVALVSLSWSLYQLPLNRVIERRLCREYYSIHDPSVADPDGTVREEFCKVEPVQQGLGRIQGVMETTWVVGDFLMTVPLVTLAERYGHRPVLMLNLIPRMFLLAWTFAVGYFDQALPLNAIMVAPLFSVLGGDCVLNSIVYSLVASSTDDDVLRATFFGQMNAVSSIFAYQLGPALASASMQRLLWLPLWIGMVLLLLAVPVASVLPSTTEQLHHRQGSSLDDGLDDMTPLLSPSPRKPSQSFAESVASRVRMAISIVTSYPDNFTLLLCGFFLTSLASSDTKLLTQYISNRYKWNFTSVGYLLSGKAVFNFILLYFVIPALLRWRRAGPHRAGHAISGQQKLDDWSNISCAHICLIFSVLGAAAIGLASTIWLLIPSLLLYALGIALPMFTYSLLRSPAMSPSKRDIAAAAGAGGGVITVGSTAQIFSIVMLVKTVGILVGAPLMAVLWVYGVGVGGIGLGLPYFVSAACYGLVIVIFSRMRENIHDPIP